MPTLKAFLKSVEKKNADLHCQVGVKHQLMDRVPTGFYGLDSGLGGGFPAGRISMIYGPESAMKTTICLKAIASAQKLWPERKCVFIDIEGHFDTEWAAKMGVDTDALVYILPPNAESAVDALCELITLEDVSVIVLDSLAALITEQEAGKSASEAVMATNARAINRLYRLSGKHLGQARLQGRSPTLLLVNQVRFKMVQMGDPETTPGGPSMRFASSLILRVSGSNEIVKSVHPTLPAFRKIRWTAKKNKVPITQGNGEILVALRHIEEHNLDVGDTYYWPTVKSHLNHLGLMQNAGPGKWQLVWPDTGEVKLYKTQNEIKDKMFSNEEFSLRLRTGLMKKMLEHSDE